MLACLITEPGLSMAGPLDATLDPEPDDSLVAALAYEAAPDSGDRWIPARRRPNAGAALGEARALLTLLGYAGPRIGEALALRHRDVRLHAAPRRLDVVDAKTPTGVREIHLSPEPADLLVLFGTSAAVTAGPSRTTTSCGPRSDGGPRSYTWALKKVHRAASIATERRAARGLPPLPNVTPHTPRHAYIWILLLVTDNVPYVMEQFGHDDHDTTNRIYRHIVRQRQEHGAAFDALVAETRKRFAPAERGRNVGGNVGWRPK